MHTSIKKKDTQVMEEQPQTTETQEHSPLKNLCNSEKHIKRSKLFGFGEESTSKTKCHGPGNNSRHYKAMLLLTRYIKNRLILPPPIRNSIVGLVRNAIDCLYSTVASLKMIKTSKSIKLVQLGNKFDT